MVEQCVGKIKMQKRFIEEGIDDRCHNFANNLCHECQKWFCHNHIKKGKHECN